MIPTALICLPYAGGGAAFFRNWHRLVPPQLTLVPVQLPGREERAREAPYTDTVHAADHLVDEVADRIDDLGRAADRVAVFGHCVGAGLGYELTRRLADEGIEVDHLYVSGAAGPRHRDVERISHLDDEAFLHGVRRIAGYVHPAIDDPEMRQILLLPLRADTAMHETYRSTWSEPLDVPVTALRGRHDALVSAADAAEWAAETRAGFRSAEIEGDHMYLAENATKLIDVIVEDFDEPQRRHA